MESNPIAEAIRTLTKLRVEAIQRLGEEVSAAIRRVAVGKTELWDPAKESKYLQPMD